MTLIDSSGWMEYFIDGTRASLIEKHLLKIDSLVVPTLVLYEVYRQLLKKIDEKEVLFAVSQMEKGHIIPLDQEIAFFAADLSLKHKLGTADAVIYATALTHQAKLVTLDNDFRNLPHCVVVD